MSRVGRSTSERKRVMTKMRERSESGPRHDLSSGPASARVASPAVPAAPVESVVATHAASDLRVRIVLQVLGGRATDDVAREWQVDATLVHRWVRDFLVAGSSAITNRPDPDEAARRDRFIAAWAHELRTPVSVAQGWLALLADGDVAADEHAVTVLRASDALDRLKEQVLDGELGSSASLGRLRVSCEPVDLGELCRELPGCPGVRRGGDSLVVADPRLLRRVLRDLWRTAHCDPQPDSVAVDVVVDGSWHEIRVVREGEPISATIIRALFDPFGANDDASGVTTGLYLARALVVAHGGFLGAEGEDHSTVLFARLPRKEGVDLEPTRLEAPTDEGGTP